jgi:hypothetical protein
MCGPLIRILVTVTAGAFPYKSGTAEVLRLIVCRYLFLSTVLTHNDVSSENGWQYSEKEFF